MFNIALNTFREIVRNKFFGIILFLSIILVMLSLGIDSLALGENQRVLTDFGLSFIELSGLAIILFLGGGLIAREIEGRTIYLILSKPIPRGQIILGKFIGFTLVILCVLLIETIILTTILSIQKIPFDLIFFAAIIGVFLKLLSLLALILLFSTFVSPGVALFMTIATTVIGHGGYAMLEYAERTGTTVYTTVAKIILIFFPNLESLNLKNLVATTATIDISSYAIAGILAIVYTTIVLFLATRIFEYKSFDTV